MKSPASFVTQLDLSLAPKLREGLVEQGFTLSQPPYTLFAGKKEGISCTFYQSGKLVVQGGKKDDFIQFYLEPEILGTFAYGHLPLVDQTPRIGSDESGKGDYFGPLCVAAVYASEEAILKFAEWGVKDSKTLQEPTILKLEKQIRAQCMVEVIRIRPAKYNELYRRFGNLNHLLAWAHATAITTIHQRSQCSHVIVDQFADAHVLEAAVKQKGITISLNQKTQGESDPVVAAASIVARAAFVQELKLLSSEVGLDLPKGAGAAIVQTGKRLVAKHGNSILERVAKLHFKTTTEILH